MWRRRVLVRQTDQNDCGAAALATVALHYRRPLDREQLRDLTGTDRLGTNLLALLRAAEGLGFAARAVRVPEQALADLPLPAIAHVRNREGHGHFVVVFEAGKDRVLVGDPARGIEKRPRAEFAASWSGNLLLLVPEQLDAARRAGRRVGPWGRMLGLLRPHTGVLLEAVFCALLMTLLGVTTSYFVQHLVDSVLVRGERQLLNALGAGMAGIVLFRTLFGALRRYLLAHVSRRVNLALVAGYARHILALPLRFYDTRRVGEILSRVNDAGKVRDAIGSTATTALVDGALVVLMLGMLWLYDASLALVASAFVPVLFVGVALHHPSSRRRSRAAMEADAALNAHLYENAAGVATIKAFGAQRDRAEEGENRLVRFLHASFGLQLLGLSMSSLSTLVTGLAGIAVLWYGGHRVVAGALTIGQLLFCYTLLSYLLEPLERLSVLNLQLQDALVAVDRLFQVLTTEPEQPAGVQRAAFKGLRRGIELRDLTFRYGVRDPVLEQVRLCVPAGLTVAIVGESGSGKSTLLNLLMGFHRPTAGRILVDGTDLGDLDLESLRGRIGLVSQEAYVFNGTVRANIALGRPDAPLEDVIEAARAAGLEDFIAGLPERYETLIGERGANLSGGQRQRLAIARALLRKPEVLIFDEATSHLDTATERAIQESLRTVLSGKTVVLVAHRLSTVRDADVIYVLHKGRVAQMGTHRQLLARDGFYRELWRQQAADAPPSAAPHTATPPGRGARTSEGRLSHA
jgi:ATP-binding cassette subfamily B protein